MLSERLPTRRKIAERSKVKARLRFAASNNCDWEVRNNVDRRTQYASVSTVAGSKVSPLTEVGGACSAAC